MKEIIQSYWDHAAEAYDSYSSGFKKPGERRSQEKWQELFTGALSDRVKKVLDVGTGPGAVAIMLAEKGYTVTGVDLSGEMLRYATRNAEEKGVSIRFEEADAESLPFDDDSFDAVVCRHLLWTTTDPEKVFSEWKRVIRPGGKIVYVDGNWYKTEGTIRRKFWKILSAALILITEQRMPDTDDMTEEMKQSLWSVKADRPGFDRALLEKIGYSEIRVQYPIDTKVTTRLEYFKERYWGPRFMISAEKPES